MAKKVYVALPMKGKATEEVIAEQEKLMARASEKLGEPCVLTESLSYHTDAGQDRPLPLECLAHGLARLAKSDFVVFGHGWENARGCKIEHLCAEEYGVPILELD